MNKYAGSTVDRSYRSWAYAFMDFANHYKEFHWKQSRWLADAHQFPSSRLPGLE